MFSGGRERGALGTNVLMKYLIFCAVEILDLKRGKIN